MANEAHNVDAVLTQVMHEQVAGSEPKPSPEQQVAGESLNTQEMPIETPQETGSEYLDEAEIETPSHESNDSVKEETKSSDAPIDEYGNPIEKAKMYTEEQLNMIVRDRLARVKNTDHGKHNAQNLQDDAKGFKADPDSEDSWEQQLDKFIDARIDARHKKQSESEWREQESLKQSAFEEKFSSGMGKYSDFHQVVAGKSITDSMMMGARNLDNPAAFVYAAAKLHPQELERIAKILDPYTQAAEVGRLHERMVKERKTASHTAKPLTLAKADIPQKTINKISIDERINQYGRQRIK